MPPDLPNSPQYVNDRFNLTFFYIHIFLNMGFIGLGLGLAKGDDPYGFVGPGALMLVSPLLFINSIRVFILYSRLSKSKNTHLLHFVLMMLQILIFLLSLGGIFLLLVRFL